MQRVHSNGAKYQTQSDGCEAETPRQHLAPFAPAKLCLSKFRPLQIPPPGIAQSIEALEPDEGTAFWQSDCRGQAAAGWQ